MPLLCHRVPCVITEVQREGVSTTLLYCRACPIYNSYLPWVGRGRKHDQHRLWWEDKGFLFLFPLPLNRLLTLQRLLLSPSRALHQSMRGRTKNQPRKKGKRKWNAWVNVNFGASAFFLPNKQQCPFVLLPAPRWHLGSELNCTFSLEAVILGRPCYWKMAGLRPALLQKAELKAWVLGACTAPMKLHGSKYRASRQGYSPGWLHFSREPLVSSIIW